MQSSQISNIIINKQICFEKSIVRYLNLKLKQISINVHLIYLKLFYVLLGLHLVEPQQCLVKDRKFLCQDHRKCINIENVCNNHNDCLDASDEGGLCNNITGMYAIISLLVLDYFSNNKNLKIKK